MPEAVHEQHLRNASVSSSSPSSSQLVMLLCAVHSAMVAERRTTRLPQLPRSEGQGESEGLYLNNRIRGFKM